MLSPEPSLQRMSAPSVAPKEMARIVFHIILSAEGSYSGQDYLRDPSGFKRRHHQPQKESEAVKGGMPSPRASI